MNTNKIRDIAGKFDISGDIESIDSLGAGFINDTFIVRTKGEDPDYILQRKNRNVFPDVPSMMDNIRKVTEHMRGRVKAQGGDENREVMRIVPAKDGRLYYVDNEGDYWAVSVFIQDSVVYERADSLELARKGGQGIGKFQALLSDFDLPLSETIKGFHNIRHRFNQWDESLAKDAAGRKGTLSEEIGWIERRREKMLDFWKLVEEGVIPTRVTHNDTKISNILFDKSGEVLCAIDLDTVMPSPALNDFGDAIRSYANTGAEDDANLENVEMSLPMFAAYTDGYLSERAASLTDTEIEWLAFSTLYITYEQVLRFLMDYIDGDKYYKVKSVGHNLQRTHAQYKLLCSMERQYDDMVKCVRDIARKYSVK